MLHLARRRLTEIGCPPYEISNYAAAGQHCQHNLVYWTGQDYIGLGPAAASHIQGYRFRNRPHLGEWEQAIDAGILPAGELEILDPLRRAGELVMLQLRLTRGVEFADFAARSGYDARQLYADQLDRFGRAGLLQIDERGFRLTEAGLNVADAIAAEFLAPQAR
jgi:oxygen-independent coproporphyrinogen-3 oxidase